MESFLANKELVEAEPQELDLGANEYDLAYLNELAGNNTSFIHEMLTTFRDDFAQILTEIEVALNAQNSAEASRLAHKGKSLAAYIGAGKLNKMLLRIEHEIQHLPTSERTALLSSTKTLYKTIILQLKKEHNL
jgi:HPt (histidine-containing phosphotransfer) domain-containing protein